VDFTAFVLSNLPPPPASVLEVGCGGGELALALDRAGYGVLAIDPDAPEGRIFRRVTLDELDDPGPFDAAIAARVLHHVHPLDSAVEKLARLTPLLLLDEFASERLDARASEWYHAHRRTVKDPSGPPDLDAWREAHHDLHPSAAVLGAARAHFEERYLEWRPYFYRWLKSPESEDAEWAAIEAGELFALGFRAVYLRPGLIE
jgi:SAM-dependent methyltransferase